MLRRTNTLRNQQSETKPADHKLGFKEATTCLRRVIEGLVRRRQYQALGKIMLQVPQHHLRVNRIKIIFFLSQQHQLRRKAGAFEKIARIPVKHELRMRASRIMQLALHRIRKQRFKTSLDKMRIGCMVFSPIRAKSVGPRLSDDLRSPILEVSEEQSYERSSPVLNKDLKTTLNIILAALSGRKFKDLKRQIQHFLKRATRGETSSLLHGVLGLVEEIEASAQENRQQQKSRLQVSNALGQLDRQLRNEKMQELERLKNRWKNNSTLTEVVAVVDSVMEVWNEVKKLRRKESSSADRQLKSTEKRKERKSLQVDNDDLKKQVKRLQLECQRLEKQLEGRKSEQRRSLPPKRPTLNQDREDPQIVKDFRLKEGQLNKQIHNLKKEIETLNKQLEGLRNHFQHSNEQAKKKEEALQVRLSQLQGGFEEKKAELHQTGIKLKEWQHGWKLLCAVVEKKQQKVTFAKEINELKRLHENPLAEHANSLVTYETDKAAIRAHMDKLSEAFGDGSWKRKNLLSKEETQLWQSYNRVVEILVAVAKERQQAGRARKELQSSKRKEEMMSQAVTKSKEEADKLRGQLQELRSSRKSISQTHHNRQSIELGGASVQKLKEENQILREKNSKIDKQMRDQRVENSRLKADNQKLRKLTESTTSTNLQLSKTVEELQKDLNEIHNDFAQLQKKSRSPVSPSHHIEQTPNDGAEKQLEGKAARLQTQLSSYRERCDGLQVNLQNVRGQCENLKLMLQQKEEEHELMRENIEQLEEEKRVGESKMMDLKHNHETTEVEIRKVKLEVEKLLNERETAANELQEVEKRYARIVLDLRNELELHKGKLDGGQGSKQFQEMIRNLQDENIQLQQKHSLNMRELRQKCEGLLDELTSSRSSHQNERRTLQARVRQLQGTRVSGSGSDEEKIQLRRQLEKRNGQLAECVRSNEREKMQLRQMIDKLSEETLQQMALHTEEKKMLREEAERARNEEYELNQQKIRKQREGIAELRQENERLTSIIDANEESFNQLIQDHQAMTHRIGVLQEHNDSLNHQLAANEEQRIVLLQKLQPLEEKLVQFEGRILTAMQERTQAESEQLKGSQTKINTLQSMIDQSTDQKRELVGRVAEQSREMIRLQGEVLRLSAQLRGKADLDEGISVEGERRQYVSYLQEQLGAKQEELVRIGGRERQLLGRVEGYVQRVNRLERQRNEEARVRGQRELELARIQGQYQKEVIFIQNKICSLEEVISRKDQQLIHLKGSQVHSVHTHQHIQTIRQLQNQKHEFMMENIRLSTQIERAVEELASAKQSTQEHQRRAIQNKHLVARIGQLQKDMEELQHQKVSLQQEAGKLRGQLQEKDYTAQLDSHIEFFKERSMGYLKDEELSWAKAQLNTKEQQLQQVRREAIEYQSQLNRHLQGAGRAQEVEERYKREVEMHKQTRQRVLQVEQTYQESLEQLRRREQQLIQQLTRKEEIILRSRSEHQSNTHQEERAFHRNNANGQLLREIVGQLGGGDLGLEGDEDEVELRILLRVSEEVSELLVANMKLREKCRQFEEVWEREGRELWWQETVVCIQSMLSEVVVFVEAHSFLPQSVVVTPPRFTLTTTPQQCVVTAAAFIKEIVLLCSQHHLIENMQASHQSNGKNSQQQQQQSAARQTVSQPL